MLDNRQVCLALALLLGGCVSGNPKRVGPGLEVQYDIKGRASLGGESAGPLVWGLGDGSAPSIGPGASAQDPQGEESPEQRAARLRTQFGSNILIAADGKVTKQYFMAGELGATFLRLITEIEPGAEVKAGTAPAAGTPVGGPESRSILGRMLGENVVEVTYVAGFEVLGTVAIIDAPKKPAVTGAPMMVKPEQSPKVDLVLITAQPSALVAFESALNLFYASIPQIEITVQVVEYTNADAISFGLSPIDNSTPILGNLSSGQLVQAYTSGFPLRGPVVGATPVADIGMFALGGIHDSWELNMFLEALEANNLADIQSSPKLVVRNGGVAAISTTTDIPFPNAKISQLGTEVATTINFKPVGVQMNIIPVIAGTNSVILQIFGDVSAITGFAATEPVTTPIVSSRKVVTSVYLKDGHTLVIGGLKSQTLFESENKVPLLGDIPLLGFLFRSTTTQRSETTVEFYITPRIVTDRGLPDGGGW